jgi:cobalt/nickel transport system permease protein
VLRPGSAADWRLVAARSALCLTAAVLLSETTTLGSILNVLRRIGVPALLITTMALMNRYLFVLADEMVRMRRARASRTFAGGRRFTWQVLATVAGRLFERAAERSDRIYAAMCARGWR